MKLERLHEYITSTTVITLGLLGAFACGKFTATGEVRVLASLLVIVACVFLALILRSRTWILLIVGWELSGIVSVLPMGFRAQDLVAMFVFLTYLAFAAVRLLRSRATIDRIDLLIWLNLFYLATVFLRNPAGLLFFKADKIGARPYFNVAISFLAYYVLRKAPATLKDIRRIPIFVIAGSAFVSLAALLAEHRPGLAIHLAPFYSGFVPDLDANPLTANDGIGRQMNLSVVGSAGMRMLCSYFEPITIFLPFYPLRFLGTCLFMTANLLSGFRTSIMVSIGYIGFSSWFRKRKRDLVIFAGIGTVGLTFLALGNGHLFKLPLAAQRALSFLPGDWDYEAVSDARASSEWRFQMWRIVLSEDKWIQSKWLGDGFGFSAYDYSIMASGTAENGGGFAGGLVQEGAMIVGAYHNGPLSAIRYVGIVGLILYAWLMIALAWRAKRLVERTRGTPLFSTALFVAMPAVFEPVIFAFVIGGFDGNLPESIFTAGLLRLLENAVVRMEQERGIASTPAEKQVSSAPEPAPPFRHPQLAYRLQIPASASGLDESTAV